MGLAFVDDVKNAITGQDAADAKANIAKSQQAQQKEDRAFALKNAEATPEELAQIQRGIALNEADITRKEKLLASSDPALIESGTQALKLLRGEEAKTLGPLKNKIAQDESKLREKLLAQLGPGYENTTAGIQALEAFRQSADTSLNDAQQKSLGMLLGVTQDTSARYGMQSNIQNASGLSGLFDNIQKRKINAMTGTPQTAAGSEFVGDLGRAQGLTNLINTGINVGSTLYGAGAFGGFGGDNTVAPTSGGNQYTLNSGSGITVPKYDL